MLKKFVPKLHKAYINPKEIYCGWVICMCAIMLFGFLTNDYSFHSDLKTSVPFLLFTVISGVPFYAAVKYSITRGLIIDGETIICKGFRKKTIAPQDIVAIKITRSVFHFRYRIETPLTDESGNQLYTMFLLKEYMGWWMPEKADQPLRSDFQFSFFNEYALCRVIYDQEVIDYLLQRNPNIIVF